MQLLVLVIFTAVAPPSATTRQVPSLMVAAEDGGDPAQNDAEVRELELRRPIERELAGGATHSYRVTLAAGQFCHATIDQRGIDVVVVLYGPDGAKMVEVDSPNYRNGQEPVSLVAEASGSYRLEVRSPEKSAPTGRYEVKLDEVRAATLRDKSRVSALKTWMEAKSLRNQRTAESLRKAIEKYEAALSVWQALGDGRMEAYLLHEMGWIYGDSGEYQKALDSYARARSIYKALGILRGEAAVLTNIGGIYDVLGEGQKALSVYDQVLEAERAIGDRDVDPIVLSNIGASYARLGQYRKALEVHLRVLGIRRAVPDSAGQAITLNNIANCYDNLGEKQKALDYYGQALALMPAVGDVFYTATTLNHIGALYRDLGEYQKALHYFGEALLLRRSRGDRNGEAATLFHIARLERDRGNLVEARNSIEAALASVESLRANVASQQLRASFFASVRQYHEFNIDLLMRLRERHPSQGFDALAVQASERARARSLLELLTETRAEIRQGVDPALLERERSLRQLISDKAEHQTRLLRGKHTEAQAAAAAKEIGELATDYEQVQAQIRQTSPRYAALTQPVPLTLKEIQDNVLDGETLLLEYSLGEERSFLWAVTPSSISSFELPKRGEIEPLARRVYEILTARNQTVAKETPERKRKRLQEAEAEYPGASAALSRILLGPVASELKDKRLLIVGEGMLQYLPFAALPEPLPPAEKTGSSSGRNVANSNERPPLIVEHEIIILPSASVLAVLRREAAGREPPDKTVAVFADPVFDRNDPRVRPPGRNPAAVEGTDEPEAVKRSASESGLQGFVRLRFSRQEAERIVRFASEGKSFEAVDFAANRAAATSQDLRHYAILHFATHGLINNQHPELSGVVLSLVDERGRPQNGFLRLYDIYNLKLDADLVVLSACQTALGKEIKGEGLVGLARGFMYAGAARVVASLWQIEDRVTAELMDRFYQRMLGQGLRPAAALRAAQVSMWKDKRWRAPHYWAAFTLQGEWK